MENSTPTMYLDGS